MYKKYIAIHPINAEIFRSRSEWDGPKMCNAKVAKNGRLVVVTDFSRNTFTDF